MYFFCTCFIINHVGPKIVAAKMAHFLILYVEGFGCSAELKQLLTVLFPLKSFSTPLPGCWEYVRDRMQKRK